MNRLYTPLYKWPILSAADSIHFKIIVVKYSKKGEGKKKKNNPLQDVDKCLTITVLECVG